MKRLFLLFYLFIFFNGSSLAQETLERSILWEISGNDLTKPSYLLGTFHMVCVEELQLKSKVKRAIEAVNQVALEVNLADAREINDLQRLMLAPKPLSSQLTQVEQEELAKLLHQKYGIDLAAVDQLAPIALLGIMALHIVPCEVKGYDWAVMEEGMRLNKQFMGLEGFKDQIDITNRIYTASAILEQLRLNVDDKKNYMRLAEAFANEDVSTLYELAVNPLYLSKEDKKILLDERNIQWVDQMLTIMPYKQTLFAVGAGHLAGEVGVIALLKAKGYQVKPILN